MPRIDLDILNQKQTPAFYASSLATRPAASFVGRIFIDSDNPSTGLYRDTGTAWIQIADPGAGTTGTLQQVTNNGNTTTLGISVAAQSFFGTAAPTSSGLLVVNNATSDNHLVILGANAPSIRIRGTATSTTLNVGLGLSTATNNFIQGSGNGDYCFFNSNTTPSPILFGIYNSTTNNTEIKLKINSLSQTIINGTFGGEESYLTIIGDTAVATTNEGTQLQIVGQTNNNYRLRIGFNTTSNQGTIQALLYGSGTFNNICLNPLGGKILIGTYTARSYLLDVKGTFASQDWYVSRTSDNAQIASIKWTNANNEWVFTNENNGPLVFGNLTLSNICSVKRYGQFNFNPLTANPAGAAKGDVYFNSITNKLKVYTGTVWETITSL